MSEQQETRSVRVKIYDREYALLTTGDPERLKALGAALDRRMREIASATGAVDTHKVAVLTALSLVDELQKARQELRSLDESVTRRSVACISLLDRLLG